MKSFFMCFVLLSVSGSALADPPSAPPKRKVFLFVDANANDFEVKTGRELARARGEDFIIVPAEGTPYREMIRKRKAIKIEVEALSQSYQERWERLSKEEKAELNRQYQLEEATIKTPEERLAFEAAHIHGPMKISAAVLKRINKLEDVADKIDQDIRKLPHPDLDSELKIALHAVKQKGQVLDHLTVSGHDGGGWFGGDLGRVNPESLRKLLGDDSTVLDQVKSIGLLGCYATTPGMAKRLKQVFPDLNLMVGYDGSAPLGERSGGWDYYKTLVGAESRIQQADDLGKIQALVKQINPALQKVLHPAFYSFSCSKDYFYSKDKGKVIEIDEQRCREALAVSSAPLKTISDYFYGAKELPKDTSKGELRDAYSFIRKNEDCLQRNDLAPFPGHTVGLLLFWNETKKNFMRYRKGKLDACLAQVNAIDDRLLEKNLAAETEEKTKNTTRFLGALEALKTSPFNADEFQKKAAEMMHQMSYVLQDHDYNDFYQKFAVLRRAFSRTEYIKTEADLALISGLCQKYIRGVDIPKVGIQSPAEIVKALKMSANQAFSENNLSGINRMDLRKSLYDLTSAQSSMRNIDRNASQCLHENIYYLESELLDPACAPFSWHEFAANGVTEPSLCDTGQSRRKLASFLTPSGNDELNRVIQNADNRANPTLNLDGTSELQQAINQMRNQ